MGEFVDAYHKALVAGGRKMSRDDFFGLVASGKVPAFPLEKFPFFALREDELGNLKGGLVVDAGKRLARTLTSALAAASGSASGTMGAGAAPDPDDDFVEAPPGSARHLARKAETETTRSKSAGRAGRGCGAGSES